MTAPSPPALQCALCWKYQRYEKYERYSRCHPRAYDDPRLNGILPLLPASFLISLSPFLFLFLFFFENLHLVRSSPRLGRKKWDQLSSSVITHFLPPSLSHFRSLECFKHSMREIFARKMEILFTEGVLTRGFLSSSFRKETGKEILIDFLWKKFQNSFLSSSSILFGRGRKKEDPRPPPPEIETMERLRLNSSQFTLFYRDAISRPFTRRKNRAIFPSSGVPRVSLLCSKLLRVETFVTLDSRFYAFNIIRVTRVQKPIPDEQFAVILFFTRILLSKVKVFSFFLVELVFKSSSVLFLCN